MIQQTTDRPRGGYAAIVDNRTAVEALLSRTSLPAPSLISRPDTVYVTVADLDDLGEWLQARGGEVHVSVPFEGVETWTLHTRTAARSDGSSVAVRVSVPVPVGESVMAYIRAAVTS